jgi:cytoskeletal protein RodZ
MESRRERPAGWGPRSEGGPGGDDASEEPADPEPRPRLGEWLREARQRKGLTFTEIESSTRINRHYLEALETEHFDVLPAPVYARGFLRSYARALGLNPDEAVALMPSDLPRPPGLDPMPGLRRSAGDAPALPSLPSIPFATRGWAIVSGAIVLLVALIWIVPALTDRGSEEAGGMTTPQVVASVPPFEQGQTPNLVGVQREVAQQVLESIGATFVAVEVPSDAPAGTVVAQTPQPGVALAAGDAVTLIVSRGPLR